MFWSRALFSPTFNMAVLMSQTVTCDCADSVRLTAASLAVLSWLPVWVKSSKLFVTTVGISSSRWLSLTDLRVCSCCTYFRKRNAISPVTESIELSIGNYIKLEQAILCVAESTLVRWMCLNG